MDARARYETLDPAGRARLMLALARKAEAQDTRRPQDAALISAALEAAERALKGDQAAPAQLSRALSDPEGGHDFDEIAFACREDPQALARAGIAEFACALALRAAAPPQALADLPDAAADPDPDQPFENAAALGLLD